MIIGIKILSGEFTVVWILAYAEMHKIYKICVMMVRVSNKIFYKMHKLPELPYQSLAPHISDETLKFHYGKHHQAYVDNLNRLMNEEYEGLSLEEVIKKSYEKKNDAIFNNAAQVWNHTFYWHCMKPHGGGKPSQKMLDLITRDFGSFEAFYTQFHQAALTQFGSGWAWLVLHQDALKIVKTSNAHTPLTESYKPLLTCDVWEHAYYLDYQNRRGDYVTLFLDHLINWEYVEENFG